LNGVPDTVDVGKLVLLNAKRSLPNLHQERHRTNDGFRIDFQPAIQAAITPLIGFGVQGNGKTIWHPSRYLEYPEGELSPYQHAGLLVC
jgi:hypothetical protein